MPKVRATTPPKEDSKISGKPQIKKNGKTPHPAERSTFGFVFGFACYVRATDLRTSFPCLAGVCTFLFPVFLGVN